MKKMIAKNHIVNITIGIIFVAFFLTTFFMGILEDWVTYIVAALIIVFSTLRFIKDYKFYHDNRALAILTIEFILALALAGVLMLDLGLEVTLTVALGALLYMRGFVYLIILQLLKKSDNFVKFLIYIAIMTLGAYILFAGMPFLTHLDVVILIIGLAIGIFYVFIGINQLTHQKPKEQKTETQKT